MQYADDDRDRRLEIERLEKWRLRRSSSNASQQGPAGSDSGETTGAHRLRGGADPERRRRASSNASYQAYVESDSGETNTLHPGEPSGLHRTSSVHRVRSGRSGENEQIGGRKKKLPRQESKPEPSSRASSSTEFWSSDDDSDIDFSPGSSRARSTSSFGTGSVSYQRSNSTNTESLAEGDNPDRNPRSRRRTRSYTPVPVISRVFSSEQISRPNIQSTHRYSTDGVFLSPPDFTRNAPRRYSAGPSAPAPAFLRPHRSTESFEGLDSRPRDILRIDNQVRSSLYSFGELAQTSRDKEGLMPAVETDLSFSKIANIADDAQYRVQAWSLAVQLPDAMRISPCDADTLNDVHSNFTALQQLTFDLNVMCSRASPADLVERREDSEDYIEYLISRSGPPPPKNVRIR